MSTVVLCTQSAVLVRPPAGIVSHRAKQCHKTDNPSVYVQCFVTITFRGTHRFLSLCCFRLWHSLFHGAYFCGTRCVAPFFCPLSGFPTCITSMEIKLERKPNSHCSCLCICVCFFFEQSLSFRLILKESIIILD